jgi:hypothetical protein
LENLEDYGHINRAWETVRDNITVSAIECIGHCEPKRHKQWFDEECLKLVDRRSPAKLQWLLDPIVVNEYNFSNVRREVSRHFRKKEKGLFERQN